MLNKHEAQSKEKKKIKIKLLPILYIFTQNVQSESKNRLLGKNIYKN